MAAGGGARLDQMSRWGLKAWPQASNEYVLARERTLALTSNVQGGRRSARAAAAHVNLTQET